MSDKISPSCLLIQPKVFNTQKTSAKPFKDNKPDYVLLLQKNNIIVVTFLKSVVPSIMGCQFAPAKLTTVVDFST